MMKLRDTTPCLYGIHKFRYLSKERGSARLNREKSHYTYRFLYFTEGNADAYLGNERICCKAGDLLYLIPGERYRLVAAERDFSLYNVFFDFVPGTAGEKNDGCVFLPFFDSSRCSPRIRFEDASVLNESRLFRNVDCGRIWDGMRNCDRRDPLYGFYGATALFATVSLLLHRCRKPSGSVGGAEPILAYINDHPEEDLSPDALSERFRYHKNHVNHLVKTATGLSCGQYVRRSKIEFAKTLLSEGELPPAQVAARLGYYDYSHFYKAFLAQTGVSPTDYLKRN